MSIGRTKDDFTTAEEIVVQCSDEDMPQDDGEDLIQLLEEEEGGE